MSDVSAKARRGCPYLEQYPTSRWWREPRPRHCGTRHIPTAGEFAEENSTCLGVVMLGVCLSAILRVAMPGAIQPGPIMACRLMFDCLMSASEASRPRLETMALKESRARLISFGRQQCVVPCEAPPGGGDGPLLAGRGDGAVRPGGVDCGRAADSLAELTCVRKTSGALGTLAGRPPSISFPANAGRALLGGRQRADRPGGDPAGISGRRKFCGWEATCTGRRVVGLAENGGSSCAGRRVGGLAESGGGCVTSSEASVN